MQSFPVPPAVLATVERASIQLSLTDATSAPGQQPLVAASPAFYKMTGYAPRQLLGHDLRCLQCSASQVAGISILADAVASDTGGEAILVNVRRDGTRWDNHMMLFPVVDRRGTVTHFLGAHFEVPDKGAAAAFALHLAGLRDALSDLEQSVRPSEDGRVLTGIVDGLFAEPDRLADLAARRLVLARIRMISVGNAARRNKIGRRVDESRGRAMRFGA